jgi:hypothetical protein
MFQKLTCVFVVVVVLAVVILRGAYCWCPISCLTFWWCLIYCLTFWGVTHLRLTFCSDIVMDITQPNHRTRIDARRTASLFLVWPTTNRCAAVRAISTLD